jgi:hypothetical protein
MSPSRMSQKKPTDVRVAVSKRFMDEADLNYALSAGGKMMARTTKTRTKFVADRTEC